MRMLDIIERKKKKQELTGDEIRFFVEAASGKTVPDYQLAAMLMAIRLNGMTDRETTDLTLAMLHSGDMADLSRIPGIKVDKHSTGGVGDTTTLVLGPLVAACGVPVAKMSGRGLGHTGGTLDKLESIPGMRVDLSEKDFIRQVGEIGLAVVSQTAELAPADKVLYALRDVTSTVDSLPLIVSSILSKKLASGVDGIVLDVKTGSGAILSTEAESLQLAETMVRVCDLAGKPVTALVTSMDQPLGTHVGNALEVKEAIDLLAGRVEGDLLEVSLMLGGTMVMMAGKAGTEEEAEEMLREAIASGRGLRKMEELIRAQGGDPRVCQDPSLLPKAPLVCPVFCGKAGYVRRMDTAALGWAAQRLGAGRQRKEDPVDPAVGFVMKVRLGDLVTEDTILCEVHARSAEAADQAAEAIRKAIEIGPEKPEIRPLCIARFSGSRKLEAAGE